MVIQTRSSVYAPVGAILHEFTREAAHSLGHKRTSIDLASIEG